MILYGVSVFLPAFHTADGAVPAQHVLAWGWIGIAAFNPAWYANPAFWATLTWISRGKLERAQKTAAMAVVLSSTSGFSLGWPTGQRGSAADLVSVSSFGWGYYVWTLSIVLLFAAATLLVDRARESPPETLPGAP